MNLHKLLRPFVNEENLKFISDPLYLKLKYGVLMKKRLNLKNPITFNEKLQWLKLHDRNPLYINMVDKYEAKRYVAHRIGEEYIIPNYGVWDSFDQINFDSLPDSFVLKCTHDSGGLVIVKDKSTFDRAQAREKINQCLKRNFYYSGREWPYKNVKPRIIAEAYMTEGDGELADYKVHNFNGEPKFILVCRDRFRESGLTEDFFSEKWEHLPVKRPGTPNAAQPIPKPEELDQILELSRKLAEQIPFVRTDFYIIDHRIYFGEITFFPATGMTPFEPARWDKIFGDWLELPRNI